MKWQAAMALLLAFPAHAHDDTYRATVRSFYDGDTATVDIHLGGLS